LILVAVFVLTVLLPARAAQPFGGLYITSLPESADIWVDGTYIGRTPIYLDGLHAGKHAVTVAKAGWKVTELDEPVTGAQTTSVTIQLDRARPIAERGAIALHGLLKDARVSVDGGPWQRLSPAYPVPGGIHHISIRQNDGKYERTATVYPAQTTHLIFRPAAPETHSAVVAAVADYIPESAATIREGRIVLRWAGHVVVGKVGESRFFMDRRSITYDAPAGMVRGKLYLPLELILAVTGKTK
jgi:hypothetical protein